MKKFVLQQCMIGAVLLLASNGNCQTAAKADNQAVIRINQVGYHPSSAKIAVVSEGINNFAIIDAKQNKVVEGTCSAVAKEWPYSGERVKIADFSKLTKPGKYKLVANNGKVQSGEFIVSDSIYRPVSCASIKAFYINRASMPIEAKYAGKWARPAGHPDTNVLIHASAASAERPEGTAISSPKGWYDAGDYNKYIVNSSITTYTLLLAYQLHPEYYKSLNLNIPESGNNIPDVLNEVLWNLRWMLTMQDPNDGGLYHKLTTKNFEDFVMPDKAVNQRYVVQKTTAAALDFAAFTAAAYRIFSNFEKELPGLADSCLAASKKAWEWAQKNPNVLYTQPKDVNTGAYGDMNLDDEWIWAACELALSTQDPSYIENVDIDSTTFGLQTWGQVETLGLISLATTKDPTADAAKVQQAKAKLIAMADELCKREQNAAYRISINTFNWGSNSDVANQGIIKYVAYTLTGDNKYKNSAQTDIDYLLGKNATGYSFVTGFGSKQPMNIHHRPSASDNVAEPVPGFLVGGPNLAVLTDCTNVERDSKHIAKSYVDEQCSYSTNEIAINWNAPLACLVGLIDDFNL